MIKEDNKALFIFTGLLLAITFTRIGFLYYFPYGLFYDEAQYWLWSKYLDFGYYSKPPMVAWLIASTTFFCGDTIFCIKLASPLIHLLTAWGVFLIGRTLYTIYIGIWSAITYLMLPSVILSSSLISTDPPLLCAWTYSLYHFIQALSPIGKEEKNNRAWIYTGIASGLGMMSKYSMVFFLPSALLYVYLTPSLHHKSTYRGMVIAFLTAFIIYLPNIGWNINNGFVSYLHTKEISRLDNSLFHFSSLCLFLIAQIGVFGPIFFKSFVHLLMKKVKKTYYEPHTSLLLCFTLPFLGSIALISFLSRAHANWAAPCYISAVVLVVKFLSNQKKILIASLLLHISLNIVFFAYEPIKKTFFSSISPRDNARFDPFRRLKGWEALAIAFQSIQKNYPNAILLTDQRKTIAYMMYYLRPNAFNAIKWRQDRSVVKDHYDLTTDIDTTPTDQSFLFLTENYLDETLASHFEVTYYVKEILIPTHDNAALRYHVYFLQHRKALHP